MACSACEVQIRYFGGIRRELLPKADMASGHSTNCRNRRPNCLSLLEGLPTSDDRQPNAESAWKDPGVDRDRHGNARRPALVLAVDLVPGPAALELAAGAPGLSAIQAQRR